MDKLPRQDEVILMGDLNARVGDEVVKGVKCKYNEEATKNGEQLVQLCAQNELRMNNTFYPHKPQHKFTYENTRGHKSTIDYIITNRNVHPSNILDVRILSSANTGTNHSMVLAKLRGTIQKRKKDLERTVTKYNIESLQDESTRTLYQQRLSQKISENKILEDDVETAWTKLHTSIIAAADEALSKRKVKQGGQNKPWFTQEVKVLAAEKRRAYLQYRSGTTTYNQYKCVRNRVNAEIQLIKREFWERFSTEMEHDL